MSSSALLFTPPSSKSNALKKACVCHWGDKCSKFKTFFDKNQPELGQLVSVRYSNTCNFLNFYHAAINFLHIPKNDQQELKELYDMHKADPSNVPCPRIRIAKFHFPYVLALSTKEWTSPMSREKINENECYIHRSPPPQNDRLLIYNPDLGGKQSERAKKRSNGEMQFRIVPCVTASEVNAIAAGLQNNKRRAFQPSTSSVNLPIKSGSNVNKATKPKRKKTATPGTSRSSTANGVEQSAITASVINRPPRSLVCSLTKHRHKRNVEEVAARLEMEEKEAQERTPDQWKEMLAEQKSEMEEKNALLQAQVESLMEQLREKEEEVKQMKGHYEKQRKKVRRTDFVSGQS